MKTFTMQALNLNGREVAILTIIYKSPQIPSREIRRALLERTTYDMSPQEISPILGSLYGRGYLCRTIGCSLWTLSYVGRQVLRRHVTNLHNIIHGANK